MKKRREFLQFQDWIARMFPEDADLRLTKDSLDSQDYLTRTFTFQVTDACNLACSYCYQINKSTRKMPFEVAKLAVDSLLSGERGFAEYGFDKSPGIILEFIGGEPFLEVDLIDRIVDYFREQAIALNHPWAEKFGISICSNGVLYTDPKVQKFLQKNKGCVSFSVTVDGTKELHDACRLFPDGSPSYDLAHAAAMDWMNRGNYMGSKITIAPSNIVYLAECLKQMVHDGYEDINANCVYEKGWEREHATELYKQCKVFADWIRAHGDQESVFLSLLRAGAFHPMRESDTKNWCGGNGLMLAVDPDGGLYPCIRYMESSLGGQVPPIKIGNVWNGIARTPCEKKCLDCVCAINRKDQSTKECYYCPVADGCSWCSAYNYQDTGTLNKRVTYICEMHRATSLAAVYYWNMYYKQTAADDVMDLWCPKQWAVPIIGEEEYENLAALTRELGGYVNENATMVRGKENEDEYSLNPEDLEILSTE